MVIQYNENIFNEIFLDVNPTLNQNVENQELVSILNNTNFKNSLKIIEESIPKESFLGNYKNKKFRKGYSGNRKKPQNYYGYTKLKSEEAIIKSKCTWFSPGSRKIVSW